MDNNNHKINDGNDVEDNNNNNANSDNKSIYSRPKQKKGGKKYINYTSALRARIA